MEILKIKWCIYISSLSNFNTKHKFYWYYATLLSLLSCSCFSFLNDCFRDLLDGFNPLSVTTSSTEGWTFWIFVCVDVFDLSLRLIPLKYIVCGLATVVTWGCFAMMRCVRVLPFIIWLTKQFLTCLWKHWYLPPIQ